MTMFSRRRFLESAGIIAGAVVFNRTLSGTRRLTPKAPSRPWATDASTIHVSPGLWTTLPATEPSVHLDQEA